MYYLNREYCLSQGIVILNPIIKWQIHFHGRRLIHKSHKKSFSILLGVCHLKNGINLSLFLSRSLFLAFFYFNSFLATQICNAKQINELAVKDSLEHADARMWDTAYSMSKNSNHLLLPDLLDWLRLRAGDATINEYIDFIEQKEDWPGMPLLIEKGEKKLKYGENPNIALDYFGDTFPKTGHGSLVLAGALRQLGQTQDAEKVAKISWLDQEFSDNDFSLMLENFDKLLSQTHHIRLENLLWNKARQSALQMSRVIPEEKFLLAKKRLGLQDIINGSKKAFKFPKEYMQDPGALLDYSNALQHQKKYVKVSKIIEEISHSADFLGIPSKWKKLRVYHARRALRLGKIKIAYDLASRHHIKLNHLTNVNFKKASKDYVELEFLAGFISLNFQKKPEIAAGHFGKAVKLTKKKANLSKLYYWYGRSLVELNRLKEARAAFTIASQYLSTFYGQLAAERINKKEVSLDGLPGRELNCNAEEILENEIVKVGFLLLNANRIVLGVRFFKHAAETLQMDEKNCLLKLLHDVKNWSGAIGVAKKFNLDDNFMFKYSYPVPDIIQDDSETYLSLIYAIIRQESEFYSGARSGAGALGLMQVMPKTAKYLAKKLGLIYDKERMFRDELYNVRLGTQYVRELLRLFQGSTVLSVAAYNAGPGSVKKWIKSYGDPRGKGIDPLVWIEMIPYSETRNYVSRVLGNELIYRSLIEKVPLKLDRARKNFGHTF